MSIKDRGLLLGDGVYEVAGVFEGILIDNDAHLERLKRSLQEIKLELPMNFSELAGLQRKLIHLNKIKEGTLYLHVTRGVSESRDFEFPKDQQPSLVMFTQHKKIMNLETDKLKAKVLTYPDLRWKRRDIKTVNLLPNIIAANKAKKMKAYEAILLQNGKVTEGTSSNIWIIKKNNLITHPANTDILKGVTRTSILKIIKKTSLKLVEKSFTHKQLLNADEVFLTSSGSFITPILKIDKKKINNGKIGNITLKLAEMYSKSFMNG